MSNVYLHGVNTIEVERGSRSVKTVKSAVIGLIGTAPCGAINQATLCLSEQDASQFGEEAEGFTLPQALRAIFDHGAGTVLVVNVLDPGRHCEAQPWQTVSFNAQNQIRLPHRHVSQVVLEETATKAHFVEGSDYLLDSARGILTRLPSGTIAHNTSLQVSYDHLDPTKVTSADIIGSINAAGKRSGLKCLESTYNEFGFDAKLLIAPVFCTQNAVSTALIALAQKLQAITYIDAPIGTTFEQVIKGRGPTGSINFNTSSERVRLCYPHALVYDPLTDKNRLEPLSSRAAGLRAKTDLDKGFWWSSSNQEIAGIVGMERSLSAKIDDPQSEVNLLNENGITTVFNSFGTGLRLWGNRTAAFPTVTHMKNFENVRRTGDVLNESLRFFSLQYIDQPINQALIDSLCESVNAYGRKLIGDGALLGFKCWFDASRNEKEQLADGQLLLSYKYTPPPPMEHLTFETEITSEYLANLKGAK